MSNYNDLSSLQIRHPNGFLNGKIALNRSKSISNRVLIIKALCEEWMEISHLSDSDDTRTLQSLLDNSPEDAVYDAHHAGTTYRFLTGYLATQPGTQILTGSSRMKERPIKALVEGLTALGANIEYLESEGFPPLKIGEPPLQWGREVTLSATISSQYISSLMLIGPHLPNGLEINLNGELVSRPYLEMTIQIMKYFGAKVNWEDQSIQVSPGKYQARDFMVEADWSAASYYYSLAALAENADILLLGLEKNSLQGDSQMVEIGKEFGVYTMYESDGIRIIKSAAPTKMLERNFLETPDVAQTVFVMCAGLGSNALYSGLKTLHIKETDRISAMQKELAKYGVYISKVPSKMAQDDEDEYYMQDGKAIPNPGARVQTYRDHRMAMAFAPLALKFPITINEPGVVSKSYPAFWDHLESLGFLITDIPK